MLAAGQEDEFEDYLDKSGFTQNPQSKVSPDKFEPQSEYSLGDIIMHSQIREHPGSV